MTDDPLARAVDALLPLTTAGRAEVRAAVVAIGEYAADLVHEGYEERIETLPEAPVETRDARWFLGVGRSTIGMWKRLGTVSASIAAHQLGAALDLIERLADTVDAQRESATVGHGDPAVDPLAAVAVAVGLAPGATGDEVVQLVTDLRIAAGGVCTKPGRWIGADDR